jgi:mRNA interferase MazF
MTVPYCPDDGDIVWLDFNPQSGHEQAGRRPAIVLSPRIYNRKAGLCVVCPITNQPKGYPFEVPLPSGLNVGGVALSDQVKSLSWQTRRAKFACAAPPEFRLAVRARIRALLGF